MEHDDPVATRPSAPPGGPERGVAPPVAAAPTVRPLPAMLVASCGFVIVLDSFAAAVAFPRIVQAFPDTPRTTLAWLSTGYSIALSALLLVAGKLADRYGMRRVFLWGMAGFALGAVASAAAPTPALLIAARVVQGSAGACMVSTSIALALLGYPADRRGAAMGAIGIAGSVASLAGPVLAGTIIDVGGSWRWVFLVSVPIALVALVVGPRVLPAGAPTGDTPAVIDLVGVVEVVVASGLLTLGLLQSGTWGWADRRTLGALTVAVVVLVLFVLRCRRAAAPLLRLELLSRRSFLAATSSQLGSQLAIYAFFFWAPLFLTNVWGWSASAVGWVTAVPLVASFSSLPIGRYADRNGFRGLLVIGGLVGGAAMAWNVLFVGADGGLWLLVPSLLLFGAAIGLVGITSLSAALAGIEPADLAEANSVFQTSRRQVQTFGIAVVIGLLGDRSTDSVDRFRLVWIVSGVCFVVSSVVAAWYPSKGERPAGP
jgi:EmrB/QacA subfamily drug resistance transporter